MLQYPPRAELHLQVGDVELPLWQLGLDSCILRHPAVLPPGKAAIVVTVDGRRDAYPVVLTEGSDGRSLLVAFAQPSRLQFTLRTLMLVITGVALSMAKLQVVFLLLVAVVYGFLAFILGIAAWQLVWPSEGPPTPRPQPWSWRSAGAPPANRAAGDSASGACGWR